MAKNWKIAEALKIVTAGEDLKAIRDIGRRFPLFLFFILHNPLKIIEAFGERITARTVNKQLELGMLDIDKTINEPEEKVKSDPALVSYLEKGIKSEKSKEAKKEKKEKVKKEKAKIGEVEAEKVEIDIVKDAIVEDTAKQTDKEIVKKEEKEVKVEEEIDDEKIEDDDLDFNVEDLLEK